MTSTSYTSQVATTMNEKLTKSFLDVATSDGTFVMWLQAFISVIIISICGLVPIVCMPRLQRTRYQNDLLQFLIGLAIGTLTADALLHLLPISGQHRHSHHIDRNLAHNLSNIVATNKTEAMQSSSSSSRQHDVHDDDDHHNHDEGFWFGFMALVGIIGFLVLERLMVLVTDACTHREHRLAHTDAKDDSNEPPKDLPLTDPHLHHHQNHHQHQHHHLNNKTRSFMFMIITGDGLHNFFDGIAIGVSYSSSFTVGISTSIAILCHELPHEIGDFAVLIKSGMPIKRAVLYNTLSSILCLLGATTGVFIGKIDIGWVSALIAGMFLYISLVDMMPQLDCYPAKPVGVRALKLLVQVSGIVLGVLIMSLIATYESKLHSLLASYNH
uniref:Zinc transporter ZIP6 n=1 Tax=Aceria tosichella TaxID=561515 RepID=A0A6G1SHC8_9ACAR